MDAAEELMKTWLDAEDARRDHAADFFAASWVTDGPLPAPKRIIDAAALVELDEHDQAVKEARQAYYDAIQAR